MELKSEQLWTLVLPRLRTFMGRTWDVELIAEMTNSTPPTVTGWLADQMPPGGRLIVLWHLLAASGLDAPELQQLPSFNRYCGELLAFGVVDGKELEHICGLNHAQGVLAMLRGTHPMRPVFSVDELREMYDDRLEEAQAIFKARLEQYAPEPPADTNRLTEAPESPVVPAVLTDKLQSMDSMLVKATLLGAVLPLVRHFNSDACTPQQRSSLRKLVGSDEMFDLSNIVNNLCSERARDHGRSGQR